jgi:hypothetical protein
MGTYTLTFDRTEFADLFGGGRQVRWFWKISLSDGAFVQYQVTCTPSGGSRTLQYNSLVRPPNTVREFGAPIMAVTRGGGGDCNFTTPSVLRGGQGGAGGVVSYDFTSP